MHLTSIVGARPQFIKIAAMARVLGSGSQAGVRHSIIHTGQHYDWDMSSVFFAELGIPDPDFNLEVGSGSHAEQAGEMMRRLEPVLVHAKPDWALLYGDTNSTLAGAIVCAKLGIRTAHVEAGLRSFNRSMPEEINRIVADHLSDLLFCPTERALRNLETEGLGPRSFQCGDIMLDAFLVHRDVGSARAVELSERFSSGRFALATIHRAENTDDAKRLKDILKALEAIARSICPVLLPLHPRTRKAIDALGVSLQSVTTSRPLTYLEMLLLESRARFIVTDSGGVQKEAYFARVPCITTRDETEWVETLENRCNVLTGSDTSAILAAASQAGSAGPWVDHYGDGHSAERMLHMLEASTRQATACS